MTMCKGYSFSLFFRIFGGEREGSFFHFSYFFYSLETAYVLLFYCQILETIFEYESNIVNVFKMIVPFDTPAYFLF